MEKQKQTAEWEKETAIRVSRLAIAMCEQFTYGHDVEQTEEYTNVEAQYRQLEADKKQHSKFDVPNYVDYHQLG